LVSIVTVAVRGTLDAPLVLLPVLLAALLAFVLGLALIVSVLHAYYRDVAPILGAVLLPWFFLSPIFFEPGDVVHRAWARDLLTWGNPMAPFITAVRDRRRRRPQRRRQDLDPARAGRDRAARQRARRGGRARGRLARARRRLRP